MKNDELKRLDENLDRLVKYGTPGASGGARQGAGRKPGSGSDKDSGKRSFWEGHQEAFDIKNPEHRMMTIRAGIKNDSEDQISDIMHEYDMNEKEVSAVLKDPDAINLHYAFLIQQPGVNQKHLKEIYEKSKPLSFDYIEDMAIARNLIRNRKTPMKIKSLVRGELKDYKHGF